MRVMVTIVVMVNDADMAAYLGNVRSAYISPAWLPLICLTVVVMIRKQLMHLTADPNERGKNAYIYKILPYRLWN